MSESKNMIGLAAEFAYPSHIEISHTSGDIGFMIAMVLSMKMGSQHRRKTELISPMVNAIRASLLNILYDLWRLVALLYTILFRKVLRFMIIAHIPMLQIIKRTIGKNTPIIPSKSAK